MAFNYYGTYQPYYPSMPAQDNLAQLKQPSNGIVWVQGVAGAQAYPIFPNNTVTLWDTDEPTIYVKSADASGRPTLRILDFIERAEGKTATDHTCKCGDNFASKEEFKALEEKYNDLAAKFEVLNKRNKTKVEVKDE